MTTLHRKSKRSISINKFYRVLSKENIRHVANFIDNGKHINVFILDGYFYWQETDLNIPTGVRYNFYRKHASLFKY